jgi:hypothetical protein
VNEEIITHNRNALLVIEQRKLKEREEEDSIAQYVREKAEKEAEKIA